MTSLAGHLAPFDAIAAHYDRRFTDRPLGQALRQGVWRHLDARFQAGKSVLDLGCGTGADALHLAARGVHVLGLDASSRMVAQARERQVLAAPTPGQVSFEVGRMEDLGQRVPRSGQRWDGAYANFGALNCVADRAGVGRALAAGLGPGAPFVAVVMGPVCAWELAWFLTHGAPRQAFRRWRQPLVTARVAGQPVEVRYPSPRTLAGELAPWFRPVARSGLGFALPPTDLADWLEARPALLRRLIRLEYRIAHRPGAAWLSDHYVATFVRTKVRP